MRSKPLARLSNRLLIALAVASVGARAAQASGASELLYERALMSAADGRCRLFAPGVGRALAAAREQAHSAALRAGDPPAVLDATEARAVALADAIDCRARGLSIAATRVRNAYAGYARLQAMTFPGPQAVWRAERPYPQYKGPPRWGLVQATLGQGGWILFGRVDGVTTALDARRGAPPAATARLLVRDPTRLAQPYVASSQRPLAAQAPPREVSRAFLARARYPAKPSLWPAGGRGATAYQFGPEALQTLAALDPREMATLELVYPSATGERTVDAWIEVGDLAAAEAFLAAGAPSR